MNTDLKVPYIVNSQKATQLIIAGLVATTLMTTLAYLFRAMDITAPDFAALYGAIFNEQIYPFPFSGTWWMGMILHALLGTVVFSFLFDYLAHRMVLPAEKRTKGVIYGFALWLFVSAIIAPMAGDGFFFRMVVSAIVMAVTTLLCYATYGVVLDGMTRVRAVHRLGLSERRAA